MAMSPNSTDDQLQNRTDTGHSIEELFFSASSDLGSDIDDELFFEAETDLVQSLEQVLETEVLLRAAHIGEDDGEVCLGGAPRDCKLEKDPDLESPLSSVDNFPSVSDSGYLADSDSSIRTSAVGSSTDFPDAGGDTGVLASVTQLETISEETGFDDGVGLLNQDERRLDQDSFQSVSKTTVRLNKRSVVRTLEGSSSVELSSRLWIAPLTGSEADRSITLTSSSNASEQNEVLASASDQMKLDDSLTQRVTRNSAGHLALTEQSDARYSRNPSPYRRISEQLSTDSDSETYSLVSWAKWDRMRVGVSIVGAVAATVTLLVLLPRGRPHM